jgi:hypothetical protein
MTVSQMLEMLEVVHSPVFNMKVVMDGAQALLGFTAVERLIGELPD